MVGNFKKADIAVKQIMVLLIFGLLSGGLRWLTRLKFSFGELVMNSFRVLIICARERLVLDLCACGVGVQRNLLSMLCGFARLAARKVWKHTLNGVYKVWQEPSFYSLFSHVATDFSKAELELFAMVAWWIWKTRNDIKFGKQGMSGEQIVSKARDWAYEFAAAQAPGISATSRVSFQSQPMNWCCPQLQFTKLNVDAANDKSKGRTGFGAVIRNDQGKLMCAATEAVPGLISIYTAEARAILFGLEVCKKECFRKVEVESDALNVIKSIEGGDWELSQEGPIFDEIQLIASQFEEIHWKKIPRQCNTVAHALAKAAIPVVGPMFWKEVGPSWLECLVFADVSH